MVGRKAESFEGAEADSLNWCDPLAAFFVAYFKRTR